MKSKSKKTKLAAALVMAAMVTAIVLPTGASAQTAATPSYVLTGALTNTATTSAKPGSIAQVTANVTATYTASGGASQTVTNNGVSAASPTTGQSATAVAAVTAPSGYPTFLDGAGSATGYYVP